MFCLVVPVAAIGGVVLGGGWWCPPWCRWLPPLCQWWRCLPGAGGCLPGASGGGASMVPVVEVSFLVAGGSPLALCLVPRQHIAAGAPGGYARQLLSAAGSLAPESKLQE